MNVETKYKPNWRARIVWMGQKPTDETINRDNADRLNVAKNKKDKTEFLETIKDCDYLCARLEKIISNNQVSFVRTQGKLSNLITCAGYFNA